MELKVKIPVCWHAQDVERGYFNCTTMLNDAFDEQDCTHYAARKKMPEVEGAVVIVHGGREEGGLDRLNEDISELLWVLLIFLGDEEASFPAELVEHPNKIVWVQEPLPGKHDFADRFMLDGYTPFTQRLKKNVQKEYEWCFAGQVTHARRRACRDALQSINWGGVIVESKGYCQGISDEEYHSLLSRSKFAPCPSGPHSPDSARVCEALECVAIPILDDLSPTRPQPGFWRYVLGDHPMPVITDWSELPGMLEDLRRSWVPRSIECQKWWLNYRWDFLHRWLPRDVEVLRQNV